MSKSKKTKKRKSNIVNMPLRQHLPEHIEKGPTDSLSSVRSTLDTAVELSKTQENMTLDWFKEKEVDTENFDEIYNEFSAYHLASASTDTDIDEEEYATFLGNLYAKFATEATDSHIEEFETDETGNERSKMIAEFVIKACANWKSILDTREQIKELEKEYEDLRESEADRLTSKEYDEAKVARIEKLQADVESMISANGLPSAIAKKKREIRLIQERFTVNYLYDRINDEVIGEKEKQSLVNAFFSNSVSAYVTKRFRDKCKSWSLDISILNHLINLEENYLPEEYNVYNNFYLFFIMRTTGHTDTKDVNEIKQVFRNMINLVYNKFYDDETRQTFIDSMKGFLDKFADYRALFESENILQPNHPYRIKKDAEISAMKRSKYLKVIETDYPEEMDTQEKIDKIDAMSNQELVDFIKSLEQAKEDKKLMEEAIEKAEEDIAKTAEIDTEVALVCESTSAAEVAEVKAAEIESVESSDILYVQTDPTGTEIESASYITPVPSEKVSDEEPEVEVAPFKIVSMTETSAMPAEADSTSEEQL
jgi:hypothetical protein